MDYQEDIKDTETEVLICTNCGKEGADYYYYGPEPYLYREIIMCITCFGEYCEMCDLECISDK